MLEEGKRASAPILESHSGHRFLKVVFQEPIPLGGSNWSAAETSPVSSCLKQFGSGLVRQESLSFGLHAKELTVCTAGADHSLRHSSAIKVPGT